LVDAARTARSLGDVSAREQVHPLVVPIVRKWVNAPEPELLGAGGRGAVGTRFPVVHDVINYPVVADRARSLHPAKLERCGPALVTSHLTDACVRACATRGHGPGLNHRLLVNEDIVRFGPVAIRRDPVGSV